MHKSYDNSIKRIIGHLKKKHKLVTQGTYKGIGMAVGPAIGAGIGAAIDNYGAGLAIGTGLGAAIGSALEANAKKKGKII